jgi:hypothetical protein
MTKGMDMTVYRKVLTGELCPTQAAFRLYTDSMKNQSWISRLFCLLGFHSMHPYQYHKETVGWVTNWRNGVLHYACPRCQEWWH